MQKWRPENEINPGVAKDWGLGLTEQRLIGAMAVSPGMTLTEAANVAGVKYQSAKNAMHGLKNRLQRAGDLRPDCDDTQALVAAYLLTERDENR